MKKAGSLLATLMIVSLMFFYSCNTSDTVINGNWTRAADFGGSTRSGAFQFTINDTTYVGLGYGGRNGNQYLLDSYKFKIQSSSSDTVGGHWRKMAIFPGIGRELSVSFALGNKGYVGTGYNRYLSADSVQLNDFWEYDPATNKWTRLKNFMGNPRFGALAFASNENGYVGSGYDGDYYDDFYKYTPEGDHWTPIPTPPSPKRRGASSLSISGKFYYFGGDSNGIPNTDFLQYDPSTSVWTNLTKISTDANFPDYTTAVRRSYAATLTLDGFGYVICGGVGTSPSQIVYQYDPIQLLWTKMTSFEGGGRSQSVAFVIDDRAFVGTGANGTTRLDDIWEWKPTQTYDANN